MKYAVVEGAVVVNIAKSDSPMAENWIPAGSARIGDSWDGAVFTSPAADPMKEWMAAMAATDEEMPRYIEDILDKIGTVGLAQEMIDRFNSKKSLRASKPT